MPPMPQRIEGQASRHRYVKYCQVGGINDAGVLCVQSFPDFLCASHFGRSVSQEWESSTFWSIWCLLRRKVHQLAANYWPPQEHGGNSHGLIGQFTAQVNKNVPSPSMLPSSHEPSRFDGAKCTSHVQRGKADDVPRVPSAENDQLVFSFNKTQWLAEQNTGRVTRGFSLVQRVVGQSISNRECRQMPVTLRDEWRPSVAAALN